jgi:hypothetical protein
MYADKIIVRIVANKILIECIIIFYFTPFLVISSAIISVWAKAIFAKNK